MNIIVRDQSHYLLKIENGKELMEEMKQFCKAEEIEAGTFSFIGAVKEVELWWYDVERKEYRKKTFPEQLEIAGALGNVARLEGEIVVHAHGTFSDKEYVPHAGHIGRAVVSGACEVSFARLQGAAERGYDEETGLNLLQ